MKLKFNKKSQIVTIDLMVAVFIFVVLFTAIMLMWNRQTTVADKQIEYEEAQFMVYQASDIMIKSRGKPADWEKNSSLVHVIGLAGSDRHLSSDKVSAFLDMNYNHSKKVLNIPYYDFSFQIRGLQGSNLTDLYGNKAAGDFIISLKRYIFYENEKAIAEFKLWK